MKVEPRKFTAADLAREVGEHLLTVASHSQNLAEGMWNPHFCAANANNGARKFLDDLERAKASIERRLAMHAAYEAANIPVKHIGGEEP